jgi:hypothetical protein
VNRRQKEKGREEKNKKVAATENHSSCLERERKRREVVGPKKQNQLKPSTD